MGKRIMLVLAVLCAAGILIAICLQNLKIISNTTTFQTITSLKIAGFIFALAGYLMKTKTAEGTEPYSSASPDTTGR